MASWAKKIAKNVGTDVHPDEVLQAGMLVQPSGTTRRLVAKGVGGLAGAAIVDRFAPTLDVDNAGTASLLPEEPLVLGITDRRLLVWSWAQLSGKPKELRVALPREAIVSITIEKKTTGHTFRLTFTDGTACVREAPKVGNQTEAFVAAFYGG